MYNYSEREERAMSRKIDRRQQSPWFGEKESIGEEAKSNLKRKDFCMLAFYIGKLEQS